jgi:hypothetical protein
LDAFPAVSNDAAAAIAISRFAESDAEQWARFVQSSNNGTLFHDVRFLNYHPEGRFRFEHLIARRGNKLLAVVPGGIVTEDGRARYVSPLGASVGGPVTAAKLRLSDASNLVKALQSFAAENSLQGIELTLPPTIYLRCPSETLGFVLLRHRFQIAEQRLTLAVPLSLTAGPNRFEHLFRATSANEVRSTRRLGVTISEGGVEFLPAFLALFEETYQRLGSRPTHSATELQDLLEKFPQRIRIVTATLHGRALAAILLLLLNDIVAYSFYHVMNEDGGKINAHKAIFADVIDRLADAGYRWLDLGPSASLDRANDSVVFFKEGLGAVGQLRTTWRWELATLPR